MPNHEEIAAYYVKLHNDASKEYTAAFKSIGARMWHDDDCHPLKPKHQAAIAENMKTGLSFYLKHGPIIYPLTVLDSYPQARKFVPKLEKEVKRIYARYNKLWKKYVSTLAIVA